MASSNISQISRLYDKFDFYLNNPTHFLKDLSNILFFSSITSYCSTVALMAMHRKAFARISYKSACYCALASLAIRTSIFAFSRIQFALTHSFPEPTGVVTPITPFPTPVRLLTPSVSEISEDPVIVPRRSPTPVPPLTPPVSVANEDPVFPVSPTLELVSEGTSPMAPYPIQNPLPSISVNLQITNFGSPCPMTTKISSDPPVIPQIRELASHATSPIREQAPIEADSPNPKSPDFILRCLTELSLQNALRRIQTAYILDTQIAYVIQHWRWDTHHLPSLYSFILTLPNESVGFWLSEIYKKIDLNTFIFFLQKSQLTSGHLNALIRYMTLNSKWDIFTIVEKIAPEDRYFAAIVTCIPGGTINYHGLEFYKTNVLKFIIRGLRYKGIDSAFYQSYIRILYNVSFQHREMEMLLLLVKDVDSETLDFHLKTTKSAGIQLSDILAAYASANPGMLTSKLVESCRLLTRSMGSIWDLSSTCLNHYLRLHENDTELWIDHLLECFTFIPPRGTQKPCQKLVGLWKILNFLSASQLDYIFKDRIKLSVSTNTQYWISMGLRAESLRRILKSLSYEEEQSFIKSFISNNNIRIRLESEGLTFFKRIEAFQPHTTGHRYHRTSTHITRTTYYQ